jgi:hypothetical protein
MPCRNACGNRNGTAQRPDEIPDKHSEDAVALEKSVRALKQRGP